MSIKCLYIANYRNISGYSSAAVNHILALDSAGVNVVPRHINLLNNQNNNLPERIRELEMADDSKPDIVLLHTLPAFYEYCGRAKSVGFFMTETDNFINSGWAGKLNCMDVGLIPCFHNKQSAINSGVKIPLHIVPLALNTSKYNKQYETHKVRQMHPDKFIFYSISEWTSRKNIEAIVRAFLLEFHPAEPVELFIKTTPVGLGDNPIQSLQDKLLAIKQQLKLYAFPEKFKKEMILCEFTSEDVINSIHQSCDCFVSASRGESFNLPLADALGFGRAVVAASHSGQDYVNDKNAFVVDSYMQPCYAMHDTMPDLYTGAENIFETSINSLRLNMRAAFEKRDLVRRKAEQARKDIQRFSLENVGRQYKQILEKILGNSI